jgi:hypothetical protein
MHGATIKKVTSVKFKLVSFQKTQHKAAQKRELRSSILFVY